MPDARQGWRVGDSGVIAAGGREGASEGGWVVEEEDGARWWSLANTGRVLMLALATANRKR